jgi:hypothetical protein
MFDVHLSAADALLSQTITTAMMRSGGDPASQGWGDASHQG